MPTPDLSVIVASVQSAQAIAKCLEALRAACNGVSAEFIVVEAGREDETRSVVDRLPGARLISLGFDELTPRLWSEGIHSSSGRVVALTTAQFRVSRGWAAAVLSSLEGGASAVGGPITLAREASSLDAAVFFLRYSAFIGFTETTKVTDIAGDNAAYRRDRIPDGLWSRSSGFWELDVNREIVKLGGSILWNDDMSAEFSSSFPLETLLKHRFEHGRLFGKARVSRGERPVAIALKAPLVPAAMMARAARKIAPRREYRSRFATAMPALFAMATAWATGEAAGALEGQRANRS